MKISGKAFLATAAMAVSLSASHTRADINAANSESLDPPLLITRVATPATVDKESIRDAILAGMDLRNNAAKSAEQESQKKKTKGDEDGEEWRIDQPKSIPVSGDIRLDVIMNIAKQAWSVYVENRGKVDYKYSYANAVPKGITSSSDLVGFSDVVFQSYNIRQKDWMGLTKFDLTFTLVFQHGGNYSGKGHYLETISLVPTSIYAGWCEKINAEVNHISTSNVGTKEDPIASAAIELAISSHCSVGIGGIKKSILFQVRGDNKPVRHTIIARD